MMSTGATKTWVTSDMHLMHNGVCKFLRNDGSKLRPWHDAEIMTNDLVANFNDMVGEKDKCYFLGDMSINRRGLDHIGRLNGDKVLIKGNHDIFKLSDYMKYFRDIRAYQIQNNIVFSHIPVHPESRGRFRANVHGHTHANMVLDSSGNPDPWYINVCVENTNFQPILLSKIYDMVDKLHGG
jgi:calcineurin-like phosphoesterase family protein